MVRPSRFARSFCCASVLALVAACDRQADAIAQQDVAPTLEEGAVRQPIPAGIDPAMVTWRSDGVLIPSDDSLRKTPGYVVDSIFEPEEMLRRFQAEAGAPVAALSGGASSTDALLRQYWAQLAAGDSLALRPLVTSQTEYAYLYFPESREPADGIPPAISWLLLGNNSGRGLARAMSAARGADAELKGTTCQPLVVEAGRNRIHGPCAVIRERGGRPDTLWFVKHIIERDGTFKLLSFANEL